MTTLVCTCGCAEPLHISAIPDDCGSVDFGYPYLFVLQNPDADNSALGCNSFGAHTVPTVDDFENLSLLTNQCKAVFLGPITNGQKAEVSRESQTGADTIDGLETGYSQTIGLTGKFKLLDETILGDLAKLNCNTRVRLWYVTSKGYLFGGLTGFIVPNFFSDWLHEGFGNVSHVPINFQYKITRTDDFSATAQDVDYLTLVNV
jgi:hypothetical protein